MKRLFPVFVAAVMAALVFAADSAWQYARIAGVRKSVTTNTRAWVVNTPIGEDQTVFTISVNLDGKLLVGRYELLPQESPPPPEWTANYPLKVQIQGDTMYLRSPAGDVTAHIIQRKTATPMPPLTADEKKRLAEIDNPPQSMIGFSQGAKTSDGKVDPKPDAQQTPTPTPAHNVGSVMVRSVPYLSEIFVDGNSMGYTPAKINLAPGKHSFRVEKTGYKPWTKEMMVTAGSELMLDASLEKK